MNRSIALAVTLVSVAGALAWACSDDSTPPPSDEASSSGTSGSNTSGGTSGSSGTSGTSTPIKAKATIKATSDASRVEGTAEFVENGAAMTVTVAITSSGGTPGEHGLHIHDKGSCDAVDGGPGLGAGGHWNPADSGHGFPSGALHHLGDLGNIAIDDAGQGSVKLTVPTTTMHVHDGPNSVVGHAVIYHAQMDDGVSQPVGNAGARPGCGVIQKE